MFLQVLIDFVSTSLSILKMGLVAQEIVSLVEEIYSYSLLKIFLNR